MEVLVPLLAVLVILVVIALVAQARREGTGGVRSVDAADPALRLTELEREVHRLHDQVRARASGRRHPRWHR